MNLMTTRTEPPWAELDPKIVPVVRVLWDAGFTPTASCEGGPGHVFGLPTVVLQAKTDPESVGIAALWALFSAGYHGLTLKLCTKHQASLRPWGDSSVEIEVWQLCVPADGTPPATS